MRRSKKLGPDISRIPHYLYISAWSEGEHAGRLWKLAARLSYLGFVAAMVMAILIVLRLMWRWIRGRNPLKD